MPLFSLSAAHANDRAGKGEFVLVNAALMLFYSFGAVVGPLAASYFMQAMAQSLFLFSAGVYAIFIAITLYRMGGRGAEGRRGVHACSEPPRSGQTGAPRKRRGQAGTDRRCVLTKAAAG